MSVRIDVSPQMKRKAYHLYAYRKDVTVSEIAATFGVGYHTFLKYRKAWRWPDRRQALAQAFAAPVADALEDIAPPGAARDVLRAAALALAHTAHARINSLALAPLADPDKAARMLADYARTLTTAQSLLHQQEAGEERMSDKIRENTSDNERRTDDDHATSHDESRTLHELRDELARRLERLVTQEEAQGGDSLVV